MDYANGKIYVIRNHVNDMVYVGSTCQSLSKRFSWHKSDMKNRKYQLYEAMNELKIENFYIELVELYPCSSKDELRSREGQYIRKYDSYKNGYNMLISGRSMTEYYQDNKEQLKEQVKKYRDDHKDKIREQKKEYYQDNKEKINEYYKKYKELNKDRIREHKNKKFNCECGGKYTHTHKARHLKTLKHKKYIDEQQKLLYIVNI